VRMDSALYAGYTVPPYYDSLIAKLIVHDVDRATCLRRLERALAECVIEGVDTNLPLLRTVIATSAFRRGEYDTGWLGKFIADWEPPVV
jgi:acetyl-CoA carboxylase biotin carboxylase subunit